MAHIVNFQSRLKECPVCGQHEVITQTVEDRFTYGEPSEATEIRAEIPVNKCRSCGFQYLDAEGEQARHEAVCRHFGLLTPKQILRLRTQRGCSRQQFRELTGIGEASLARWESGHSLQSFSNDRYLFLLSFDDNWRRLARKNLANKFGRPTFPALSDEDAHRLSELKQHFELRTGT